MCPFFCMLYTLTKQFLLPMPIFRKLIYKCRRISTTLFAINNILITYVNFTIAAAYYNLFIFVYTFWNIGRHLPAVTTYTYKSYNYKLNSVQIYNLEGGIARFQ